MVAQHFSGKEENETFTNALLAVQGATITGLPTVNKERSQIVEMVTSNSMKVTLSVTITL